MAELLLQEFNGGTGFRYHQDDLDDTTSVTNADLWFLTRVQITLSIHSRLLGCPLEDSRDLCAAPVRLLQCI
jgi:hypothetical protein